MPDLSNPAGRLLTWFNEADRIAYDIETTPRPFGRKLREALEVGKARRPSALDAWGRVWGCDPAVPPGHNLKYLERAHQLQATAVNTLATCKALPDGYHPNLLLSDFESVQTAVNQALYAGAGRHVGLATMRRAIKEARPVLERIELTLTERGVSDGMDLDSLARLRVQVRDLRAEVLADESLEDDVKAAIAVRLRQILDAIRDAAIEGTPPLRSAAETLLGAVQLEPDLWSRVSESKWGPRIGGMWLALMTTLGGLGATIPALLPNDSPTPALEAPGDKPLDINTDVCLQVVIHDGDVVDAEIVEHDEAAENQ